MQEFAPRRTTINLIPYTIYLPYTLIGCVSTSSVDYSTAISLSVIMPLTSHYIGSLYRTSVGRWYGEGEDWSPQSYVEVKKTKPLALHAHGRLGAIA